MLNETESLSESIVKLVGILRAINETEVVSETTKKQIKILQYISNLRKLGQCNSIFISSATKTHFKYIKKFINKDTYIYCEKPGPTNLKQINFLKKLPNKIKKR